MSENSTSSTFWNLINSFEINIPQLQRDYAQGRVGDDSIKQIRNALVDELYEAIFNKSPLVLNFIYGETTESKFIPIDGQQRLTTLFLLHWYIFSRASYHDGLNRLKKFSYMTRNTSRRFCERLCDTKLDYRSEELIKQITDSYWFTGNFSNDPTIKSMLTMIETIHNRFKREENYEEIKDHLISDECLITFLWLPMDNFQKTDDLYIKMNARGKLLSDFEIFKAKLQNSQLLDKVLEEATSEKSKILYISKFNNQYAELFYSHFQDNFDSALMDFVKSIIRDDYFCYVSEAGVGQKEYRDHYKQIQGMNGSVFFRFSEKNGFDYKQCNDARNIFASGIKKVDKLLEIFSTHSLLTLPNSMKKEYYDEKILFIKNSKNPTFSDNVIRYALYSYIYKFGYPDSTEKVEAYSMWKRFIYNMVENTDFEGLAEYICEAMVFFKGILSKIEFSEEKEILNAIVDYGKATTAMKYQYEEEVLKSKLILLNAEWRYEILAAEEYFTDGQIGFLLAFCRQSDGHSYDLKMFREYFMIAKELFTSNKHLSSKCDSSLFEKALLCMPDPTLNKTAHLEKKPNSTTSWGFYRSDYNKLLSNAMSKDKRFIVKALFEAVGSERDINLKLQKIINNTDLKQFDDTSAWKRPFIENDLFGVDMGYYRFKNCVYLNNKNTEILLLAGTTVRAYSMELYTYLLYRELVTEGVKGIKLKLETTAILKDSEEFPLRYIEYKGIKIGYSNKHFICKEGSVITEISYKEAVKKILS